MTYWIVMFPEPLAYNGVLVGPIKLKVKREAYEVATQEANATIDCEKGTFLVTGNKRKFQTNDGLDIFLVVDVRKIKK